MKVFPVRVPRDPYRGKNEARKRKARKFDADASTLEYYLNERIAASQDDIQQFFYGFIAPDVAMTEERVREILFRVDAGHNGITVAKSAEALDAFLNGT